MKRVLRGGLPNVVAHDHLPSRLPGRPVAIGAPDARERFARYAYRADGVIAAERLGDAAAPPQFARDALRRLVSIDDAAFTAELGYRVSGAVAGPIGDGRLTWESTTWKAQAFLTTPAAATVPRYCHDGFGRLAAAQADRPAPAAALAYDADDNIVSRSFGMNAPSVYRFEPATNRLTSISTPSLAVSSVRHDATGAVTRIGPIGLRYDAAGGRPSGASMAGERVDYYVNAEGERVLSAAEAMRILHA